MNKKPLLLLIALVPLLLAAAQPSSLASVDDVIVENSMAKRIMFPNLIGSVNVSAMASALKVKPSELINITIDNLRGSVKVSLKIMANVTRQRVRDSFDCDCKNYSVSVFDKKLGYNVTVTREVCDTCYSYENYTVEELINLDPVNLVITRDTEIYEVFEGCDRFDWGCSGHTTLNLLGTEIIGASWFSEDLDECRNITVTSVASGTLSSFRVLINLTNITGMLANLHDIRFTNNTCGTGASYQLAHEIDYAGSSYGIVHVRVDSLPTSNADIGVYFNNNTNIANGENITGVYKDTVKLAYHMADYTTSQTNDSTTNSNHGVKGAANEPIETASGKIYKGQDFDGGDDAIEVATLLKTNLYTFEIWVYPKSSLELQYLYFEDGAGYSWCRIDTDGSITCSTFDSGDHTYTTANNVIQPGNWYHIVNTVDIANDVRNIYVNGLLNKTDTTDVDNLQILEEWRISHTSSALDSIADEVYIHNIALSADEINQTYQLTENQETYVTISAVQKRVVDACTYSSGDWNISCADDCSIVAAVDLGGNDIHISGTGTFHTTVPIRGVDKVYIKGTSSSNQCVITCVGDCFRGA